MLGQDNHEKDTKTLTNSDSELTNALEMVKKPIQAFESLNSDIRARSQAHITILGQDEHETDAKNRTSTNLASQLTNPFEMVKKTIQAFKMLNFEVRARSQSQITILSQDEMDINAKNWAARNSASEITSPLEMVKKQVQLWNRQILMSEIGVRPKLRCWTKMTMKQTRKIGLKRIQILSSRTPWKW